MNKRPRIDFLKVAVHIGALIPLALLVADLLFGSMINPIQEATQRTGRSAIALLAATLACTPLHIILNYRPIAALRKPLGRYTLLYAAVHMLLYVGFDYGFAWSLLLGQFKTQPFMWAALGAFIILLALGVTSFKWWMKRLGKNWKRLHRLVYLAGVFAVIHYALVVKGDLLRLSGNVTRPLIYAVIITFLLVIRLPPVRKWVGDLLHPKPASKEEMAKPLQGTRL